MASGQATGSCDVGSADAAMDGYVMVDDVRLETVSEGSTPEPAPLLRHNGCRSVVDQRPAAHHQKTRPPPPQLQRLLRSANENGSFGRAVLAHLGISLRLVRRWAAVEWGDPPASVSRHITKLRRKRCQPRGTTLFTALTVAHLQAGFPEQRECWAAAAGRALVWLDACEAEWVGCVASTSAELVASAAAWLRRSRTGAVQSSADGADDSQSDSWSE
mmetsp:Transcript_65357/g.191256  ORF Transcript_65357/g.191256 Transcript_65357/m.191256 type:complete len:217 (-) Transcript_65357:73-723(-)